MADTIICPACGESNPADIEFCQNCQSRLHPLTGPLKGENAPIQPGQSPTRKVTSELEPVLPQWLREARQQARESAQEDSSKLGEEPKSTPRTQGPDLLAGLASQSAAGEEEETPDWLSNITGQPSKKKKHEPEDAQMRHVELGHTGDLGGSASSDEEPALPWTANQEPAPEKDELTEWFKEASASAADEGTVSVPADESQPEPSPESEAGNIEWFRNLEASTPAFDQREEQTELPAPSADETPNWLKNLEADASFAASASTEDTPSQATPLPPSETPDWLKNLGTETPTPEQPSGGQTPPSSGASESSSAEVPDWLKSFGQDFAAPELKESQPAEAVPAWLGSTSQPESEPPVIPPQAPAEETSASGELPDWLASLKPVESQSSEPGGPSNSALSALKEEPPSETASVPASPSAFVEGSLSNNDVDAIFASMQMPDWLSDATPGQPPAEESLPPAAQEEQPIAPVELPSWVQAMRPVESAMPDSSTGPADTTLETRGPLAGLHGVLPTVPGIATPSSKPKAHSLKLDATEQQQAHAALLEKILAAETAPVPMKATSLLGSQRALRWALSLLLIVVLGGASFAQTPIFSLPNAFPPEADAAVRAVEAVPEDAPVLVVFDYEPSTVGEMEATGASLLDHLLLLKHPHLALLSTSPTGPALGERFMSTVLRERTYQRGLQYVDLGYLPGGLAGVYTFAQNPAAAMPLDADAQAVWGSPMLQGVTHLSDFAAIIVLTDRLESGRVWIEQAGPLRGNSSLILISSAQAGPMLLPYVDAGQANGLVAGLNSAVGVEVTNGGLPGYVRRYWDAYNLGLWLAAAAMVLGGLWSLWRGVQDRRPQEAL